MKPYVLTPQPQLVRKRTVINLPKPQQTVQPGNRVVNRTVQPAPKQVQIVPSQPPAARQSHRTPALVTKKAPRKSERVNGQVKFITDDTTKTDIEVIRNMHNSQTGRILVILGNGPSLSEVDLSVLKDQQGIDVLTVNRPDQRIWPTKYWVFFDMTQYRRNQHAWQDYTGTIINSTSIKVRKNNSFQIKNRGGHGFSLNLTDGVHIGRSSVYASMQIALWLGYDHTYILGCDMQAVDGRLHFYGQNQDVKDAVRLSRFDHEAEYYDHAANVLDDETRSRFTFCSDYLSYGFATRFNKTSHRGVAQTIINHARP